MTPFELALAELASLVLLLAASFLLGWCAHAELTKVKVFECKRGDFDEIVNELAEEARK